VKRSSLVAVALLAVVGCDPGSPPLEVRLQSPAGGVPAHDAPPDITGEDIGDAGPVEADAGVCCPVLFRLAQQADEATVELRLVGRPRGAPATLDAGVWSATACMVLERPERYYYSVGITVTDETQDGGLFMTTRTNPFVDTEFSPEAPLVNVFETGAVTSCAALDAGAHARVP
jgi:hypothetical protein